jgi:hypothetical protein
MSFKGEEVKSECMASAFSSFNAVYDFARVQRGVFGQGMAERSASLSFAGGKCPTGIFSWKCLFLSGSSYSCLESLSTLED